MSRPLTLNMNVVPGSLSRGRWIKVIVRMPNFLDWVSREWVEDERVAVAV